MDGLPFPANPTRKVRADLELSCGGQISLSDLRNPSLCNQMHSGGWPQLSKIGFDFSSKLSVEEFQYTVNIENICIITHNLRLKKLVKFVGVLHLVYFVNVFDSQGYAVAVVPPLRRSWGTPTAATSS